MPVRELTAHKVNGLNEAIKIEARDEPGPGGACHGYRLTHPGPIGPSYSEIRFQKGPIAEAGVNGISNEALLAILIDRLEGFQSGPYANDQNEGALGACRLALWALQWRTRERLARGVEGTSAK